MVQVPPPKLDLITDNPNIPRRIKRRRVPNTWKYIKTPSGPDKGNWAGDAFTLSSRAKAARAPSSYEDLFPQLKPHINVLGPRHQTVRKFVVKKLIDRPDIKISLFMGGEQYIFVREIVRTDHRYVSASTIYSSLRSALRVYQRNEIYYKHSETLPLR